MTSYEELRVRHMADAMAMVPEMIARLDWDADQLAAHRTQALRAQVRVAVDRSPWHRKRLAGVDPETLEVADLAQLPVMTKADVMAHFDEIVTDDRLRLADVEEHLLHVSERGYLHGQYTAVATGGSTGQRGVTVYDWNGWATWWVSAFRNLLKDRMQDPALRNRRVTVAFVTSAHPSHVGAALARTFRDPGLNAISLPVTLPVESIVEGLNACRPEVVLAYPTALMQLTREAAEGRLRIAPRRVLSVGEPLLPEVRAAIADTWSAPITNGWGATESGGLSLSCAQDRSHLLEDTVIVEPVDSGGRAVPSGARSAKIHLTNLFNPVLPLIRYELSDEVTVLADPCPCGSPARCVEDVQGRQEDWFHYGDRYVHPHVFRSALGRRAGIVEYQVHQSDRGADIAVSCRGQVDLAELTAELTAALSAIGLSGPQITIAVVNRLDRLPHTGKLKRFVPLGS